MLKESIHLETFPKLNKANINRILLQEMQKIRDICSSALSIRKENKLRVRIPLSKISIYGQNLDFIETYKNIILSEINVKEIQFSGDIGAIGEEILDINFKAIGAKLGNRMQQIIQAYKNNQWSKLPQGKIEIAGTILAEDDFTLSFKPKNGASGVKFCSSVPCAVMLDTFITEDLLQEGIARDVIRCVQQDRKALNFNLLDKIIITISSNSSKILTSIKKHENVIKQECLSLAINLTDADIDGAMSHDIDENIVKISISKHA